MGDAVFAAPYDFPVLFADMNLPRSRNARIGFVMLAALVVAMVDGLTGSEIRVYPFYFVPIALAARLGGRKVAIVTALMCTLLWIVSNVSGGTKFSSEWIWVWNATVQGSAFLFVALLLAQLHAAVQRERNSAHSDALTGLLNTRAFNARAPALVSLCRRDHSPLVIAYVDLDNFKKVNDTRGHARGDEILRIAARLMQSNLRASDLLARFGGDEFAALLPKVSIDGARELLERLRQAFEIAMRAENCDVTVSIGAVVFDPVPETLEEAIREADSVMYTVKKAGKNRVMVVHSAGVGRSQAHR
ncbi:MAG: GGDEF domain-containing protein [Rhodocyclales bacterium]|nr:GGDEF domain-containing protein [Rhodocyclales bacterium]